MLRAVLDTNVIVSGVISDRGIPSRLLSAWRAREWDLVISPGILHEVQRVLSAPKIARTYGLTRQDIVDLVQLFSHRALLMTGTLAISPTARDADDDPILACAKEANADYVVSGDDDLLTLERYEGIPIVSPAAFAAVLEISRQS
ncbi:PilT protein domain-containing protein [Candidatus Methylomirabilis lanthanidiphila]|uniref:PilT protein domain-containing protein n=1 Tax=Candidatus Methylomirabilis lanthanidiphila TaxID=2211376 RepID=A0A564ZJM5_9BACT|nr:putative toxin-antitoxin system toxin component, PIN family [Candidatus Methylomirabilis lanthanidiphila]VUZ85550.1 PilT protein domain-containing protein [Candidatus Methylomirabilis lanthanidiphila]